MEQIKTRLRVFLFLFIVLLIAGTLGFMGLEGRSATDAFYYVIVTIATVGYGDIHPITPSGKIFSVILIITGVGTFLGMIGNLTELMLTRRETQTRLEKLNMVIGVFFSEVGLELLSGFSDYDPDFDRLRSDLLVRADWREGDFLKARDQALRHPYQVDMERVDLAKLKTFLLEKRDFLLRLLENPTLLEHETFTDLLRAVFHLTEELAYRKTLDGLPPTDISHLGNDIKRAYHLMVGQWIAYMLHLKEKYPFLFSLALRLNPFNPKRSAVISEESP